MKQLQMLLALSMALVSATWAGGDDPARGEGSAYQETLSLPASFVGKVNYRSGSAAVWHLNMWPDGTFQYRMTSRDGAGNESRLFGLGRWQRDAGSRQLVLDHGKEKPIFLSVTNARELAWADPDQQADVGALYSDGSLHPIDLEQLFLAGMMVYMADAALITLCQTGARYPVAFEADYPALESAYLADRSAPGAPLLVMFEGGLAMREPMEGPVRQTAIVDRFLRTAPDQVCNEVAD